MTLIIFSGVAFFMFDYVLFPEEEDPKLDHILSLIMHKRVTESEVHFILKGLWIILEWVSTQLIECIFQIVWWTRLLKNVDYSRSVNTHTTNDMINDTVEDGGIVYSRNILNPDKFNLPTEKNKTTNDMFGDSDSDEYSKKHVKKYLKRELGELNYLDKTIDNLSSTLTKDQLKKQNLSSKELNQLNKKLASLEQQMRNKVRQLESEINEGETVLEDVNKKPEYSKKNMLERLAKEREEDQRGLSDVKNQQQLLLANQRVVKSQRVAVEKKKSKRRVVEDWEKNSSATNRIVRGQFKEDELDNANFDLLGEGIDVIKGKMEHSDQEIGRAHV